MEILKKYWVHLAAFLIFMLSTVVMFLPSFQGKKLNQGDLGEWYAMAQESRDYKKQTGDNALWTGSMFSGMPNYYIDFQQTKDPIDHIAKILRAGFDSEVGKFMSGLIAFYFLLLVLGVNPWLSIFGALVFAYTTNNIVLLNAGHMTKISTIMTGPYIIAGVIVAYRKNLLFGSLIFLLGMSLNLKANHPQMTYYLGIVLGIFVITEIVAAVKRKEIANFFKVSGLLLIAGLLAIGTTANRTLPIYEYSKDTMRGAPILKNNKSSDSSSKVEGLAWDYAMVWSNGAIDILSSWIPMAVGGSNVEKISSETNYAKEMRKRGMSTRNLRTHLYWGGLPSTSGPIYFGAIIFFLFFLAAFYLKGNVKWWIVSAVIVTFLLSMGKNCGAFNKLFFNYIPLFNKFRTPNSVLSVTAIIIPLLAILGLQDFFKTKRFTKTEILYPGIGFIIFTLLIGILGPGIFDMSNPPYDARIEQMGIGAEVIIAERAILLRSSALTSAFLMAATLGIMWLYSKEKMKMIPAISVIAIMALADLFIINNRYISSDNYQSKRKFEANHNPRPVDTQILKDSDLSYRVLDNTVNTFNSAFASYFHKSVGGYHAAKLQRYEDIRVYHLTQSNMDVFNMLNTKYFITGQPGNEEARLNTAALGNAWFVNKVRLVPDADAEINALSDFDPLGEAIVHNEFSDKLNSTSFDKNGTIKLDSYAPNKLVYHSNTSSPQLAVFSEVWYGPNKGWNAYLNGKKVDHIRSNYVLRALEIPAGQNEIIFAFEPDSNRIGKIISLLCNLIFLIATALYLWRYWKHNKV